MLCFMCIRGVFFRHCFTILSDLVLPARIAQMDVVTANGGVYFYLVPMIVFFVLLTAIVQEKEANLRTGMRMMGLYSQVMIHGHFEGSSLTKRAIILTSILLCSIFCR